MTETIDEIERGIEESRARLGATLDKLQSRLTPSDIVEDMLGAARAQEFGDEIYRAALDTLRRNPFAVGLICLGAVLLVRGRARVPTRHLHVGRGRDRLVRATGSQPVIANMDPR